MRNKAWCHSPPSESEQTLALSVPAMLSKGAGSSVLSSSGPCADRCPCSGLLESLPCPAFPAGKPPLTLLTPPSGPRSPAALRVRKMFPDDLPKEFLQAGTNPGETQTHSTSSLSLSGAPHPTLSTARMLHALLWQQGPLCSPWSMWDHSCPSSCALALVPSVCPCVCVLEAVSARLPHGSRLEAEASVSQTHFLAEHAWGKGQALFVSPHSFTQSQPG